MNTGRTTNTYSIRKRTLSTAIGIISVKKKPMAKRCSGDVEMPGYWPVWHKYCTSCPKAWWNALITKNCESGYAHVSPDCRTKTVIGMPAFWIRLLILLPKPVPPVALYIRWPMAYMRDSWVKTISCQSLFQAGRRWPMLYIQAVALAGYCLSVPTPVEWRVTWSEVYGVGAFLAAGCPIYKMAVYTEADYM
jgi:hypothetical protein